MTDTEKRDEDTKVSLREYIEAQIKWVDRYFLNQIATVDSNVTKAAQSIDKRLESMNEFRNTLRDQSCTFITRTEYEIISERVKTLELNKANMDGKTLVICGMISFVMSLIVAGLVAWLLKGH